jgi:uncharacterized protein (DUF1501 family)
MLQELSQAHAAFRRDVETRGNLDRTRVTTFSEFGGPLAENKFGLHRPRHGERHVLDSISGIVKAGLHGHRPDLCSLDDSGDRIHEVDFRSVYAVVPDHWFETDATRVLDWQFETFPLVGCTESPV